MAALRKIALSATGPREVLTSTWQMCTQNQARIFQERTVMYQAVWLHLFGLTV